MATNRVRIILDIEGGKIVNVTSSDGSKSRKVSRKEVDRIYQKTKGVGHARARLLAAQSQPANLVYIWLGGKWVKVPVP